MIIPNLSQTPTSLCLETFKGLLLHSGRDEVLTLTEKALTLCYFFCDLISSHSAPAHSTPATKASLLFLSGSPLPQSLWTPLQSSWLHLCYISTQMLSTTHKAFLITLFKMHTPPLIPELPISFSYSPQQHLPYFIYCLSTSMKQ